MLAAFALVALLTSAPGAEDAVDSMLREDYNCTNAEAVDVDVRTLETAPSRYVNRCIRVVGYVGGTWLLNNLGDVHGHSVEELTELSPKFIGQQIKAATYPEHESHVELIGRFRRCADRYKVFEKRDDEEMTKSGDKRPRPPIMLSGTCHDVNYAVFSAIWRKVP